MWTAPAGGSKLPVKKKKEGQHMKPNTGPHTHARGDVFSLRIAFICIPDCTNAKYAHESDRADALTGLYLLFPEYRLPGATSMAFGFCLLWKLWQTRFSGLIYVFEPGRRILSVQSVKTGEFLIRRAFPHQLHRSRQSRGLRLGNDVINHTLSNCHFQVICGAS